MSSDLVRFPAIRIERPNSQALAIGLDGSPTDYIVLDSVEENHLVLSVTVNQYTDLLSAAMAGAMRKYPENWIEVIYPLIEACQMTLCDAVADCIDNSDAVNEALNRNRQENGQDNRNIETPLGAAGNGNIFEGVSCDFDSLYGAAVAVEDYVAAITRDMIEAMVDATSDAAALARLIDFTPMVGDFPVADDLNDIVDAILIKGLGAFDIGYSTQLRQQNICYMFEQACADCEMDFVNLPLWYLSQGGQSGSPANTIIDLLQLLTGTLDETAYAMICMASVTGIMAVGGQVDGVTGTLGIQKIAQTGNPDGDWDIFCDDCSQPTMPVILESNGCSGFIEGGVIEDLGAQNFRIIASAGLPNGDNQIAIKSANGQPFTITNQSWVGGQPVQGFYVPAGGLCTQGFAPNGMSLDQAIWIAFNPGDGIQFTFTQ